MNEPTKTYAALLEETALEDRAVRLAYLYGKAKRKYNRVSTGSFGATEHDLEMAGRTVERIRRWCCKNAMLIHNKYYNDGKEINGFR